MICLFDSLHAWGTTSKLHVQYTLAKVNINNSYPKNIHFKIKLLFALFLITFCIMFRRPYLAEKHTTIPMKRILVDSLFSIDISKS